MTARCQVQPWRGNPKGFNGVADFGRQSIDQMPLDSIFGDEELPKLRMFLAFGVGEGYAYSLDRLPCKTCAEMFAPSDIEPAVGRA